MNRARIVGRRRVGVRVRLGVEVDYEYAQM